MYEPHLDATRTADIIARRDATVRDLARWQSSDQLNDAQVQAIYDHILRQRGVADPAATIAALAALLTVIRG